MTLPPTPTAIDAIPTGWRGEWAGLDVAVLGLGVTGFAAADTLVELGCRVRVYAERATEERRGLLEVIGAELVERAPLGDAEADFRAAAHDLVVVSPGFHPDHPLLVAAAATGVPVIGDVDLAWRLRDKTGREAAWITVTGTNGKTTTTQLATAMVRAAGLDVMACGNIGTPVLDAIRDPTGFDVLVVELSSYQLHWMREVSPLASVCLNVADDHLDWHGDAVAYRAAKARVYERTRLACVYNLADGATEEMVREAEVVEGARAVGFGLGVPGPSDLGIVEGILCDRAFLEERRTSALELTTVEDLVERGLGAPHVVQNVLAAAALARAAGASPAQIRDALRSFSLDAHRIQRVAEIDGVLYVDDSKATNPHAAGASLAAFERVVWVAGGQLKGVEVDALVATHAARLRAAVLIGADREALTSAFARHAPDVVVFEADVTDDTDVMSRAVALARSAAHTGDVVLLAPAAASMDQFIDYADRGRRFQAAVRGLSGGGPDGDGGGPSER